MERPVVLLVMQLEILFFEVVAKLYLTRVLNRVGKKKS